MIARKNKRANAKSWAAPILCIVVGILILLSDGIRLANLSSGGKLEPMGSGAEGFGYVLTTFLLGVVVPIWLIVTSVKYLRRSA